ncbi:DUF6883 domain-containing protein [Synechocystis sp. PCC 7339]|uniref:DUF6883 domain-containing protein n=1 Tax=Synechocystis sp. PCC 7339 TaxID=2782213 RepID=UPI001CBC2B49|nr:DUF6883 domain-containing protein [Synechocystis sp. PCC 7339]
MPKGKCRPHSSKLTTRNRQPTRRSPLLSSEEMIVAESNFKKFDAEELRQILLAVVQSNEVKLGRKDAFGQRYTLDFDIEWQNRSGTLRSAWIIEHGSEVPRLTTCYPL